jgi:hypothetical protein
MEHKNFSQDAAESNNDLVSKTRKKTLGNLVKSFGASVFLTLLGCVNSGETEYDTTIRSDSVSLSSSEVKRRDRKIKMSEEYKMLNLPEISDEKETEYRKGMFEIIKGNERNISAEDLNFLKDMGYEWWTLKDAPSVTLYAEMKKDSGFQLLNKKYKKHYFRLVQYLIGKGYHTKGGLFHELFFVNPEVQMMVELMKKNPLWSIEEAVDVTQSLCLDERDIENFYKKSEEEEKKSLERIHAKITQLRELYKKTEIIGPSRGIIMIANNEKEQNGSSRFATNELQSRLQSITSKKVKIYTGPEKVSNEEKNKENYEKMKESARKEILQTEPGQVFMFNGHGSTGGISLFSDKEKQSALESEYFLSSSELISYFDERYKKMKGKKSNDVIVLYACFSGSVGKALASCIAKYEQNTIIITSASPHTVSFSNNNSPKGATLFEQLFPEEKERSTIGDLIEYDKSRSKNLKKEGVVWESPSVIVPVPKELQEKGVPKYLQISKRDTDPLEKNEQAYS